MTTPERQREQEAVIAAFVGEQAYQRELDVRGALSKAGIPTDLLTAHVLLSVIADQFADLDATEAARMLVGMISAAHGELERGRLCRNAKCRAGHAMTRHFDRKATRCIWCQEPLA